LAAPATAALLVAVGLSVRGSSTAGAGTDPALAGSPAVRFDEVEAILQRRCLNCHAAHPSNPAFPQPPNGIVLEDPRRVRQLAPRILERAVTTKTMPLGNLTGMTEDERRVLGAWIVQGARIDGGGH
jgi:uncharacterized membrane protein